MVSGVAEIESGAVCSRRPDDALPSRPSLLRNVLPALPQGDSPWPSGWSGERWRGQFPTEPQNQSPQSGYVSEVLQLQFRFPHQAPAGHRLPVSPPSVSLVAQLHSTPPSCVPSSVQGTEDTDTSEPMCPVCTKHTWRFDGVRARQEEPEA